MMSLNSYPAALLDRHDTRPLRQDGEHDEPHFVR
jgi:hypothetical protein